MGRTPLSTLEAWVTEVVKAKTSVKFQEVVRHLKTVKSLTQADLRPQKGHENEDSFTYRCRWAVIRLRKAGIVKPESPRGVIELADANESARVPNATPAKSAARPHGPGPGSPGVWLFQANPDYYRIVDALQALNQLSFLISRYKDEIRVGDIVLLWMSGKFAGIYAQARVSEGVSERPSTGPEAEFWVDPNAAAEVQLRVTLAIERKFLADPVLKSKIVGVDGLQELMVLRLPQGTNFRVSDTEWAILQRLLPSHDSQIPQAKVAQWAATRGRSGRLYEQTCGQLLEQYIQEHFLADEEHPRSAVLAWFAERYPRFKAITVQCHVEKYTTNFRSRVHYNAGPEHDLLFREAGDWDRLRLYRPESDAAPIYEIEGSAQPPKSAEGRRAAKAPLPLIERHRRILHHLAVFGEISDGEAESIPLLAGDLESWVDALLIVRPAVNVVSPLFLALTEGDGSPAAFTTKLAVQLMGDQFLRAVKGPLDALESYIWEHFGGWHLAQPQQGDEKWHGYLGIPATEPADRGACERLDIFAQLPPTVISELIRDTSFLEQQQNWSAQAANKGALGPLSRQLKIGIRRPLFLSHAILPELVDGSLNLEDLNESEVTIRSHVIAGLPLCTVDELRQGGRLSREQLLDRILEHPLYAVLAQIEIHRMMAGLSDHIAAALHLDVNGECHLNLPWGEISPVWPACRKLLVDLGFWPACATANDNHWELAVRAALKNLQGLGALEAQGSSLRITEAFGSRVRSHPAHPQNRGEKDFRVRLLQFFERLRGDVK
jgi:hypothetical protein